MSGSGVTTVLDRTAEVLRAIAELTGSRVMVGIPSERAGRQDTGDQTINNAALGYIHENGAPEVNIPARPFLIPGVASVQEKTVETLRRSGTAALGGDARAANAGLHAAGLRASSAVKAKITAGPFAPLAESTLAARRARGVKRTKPLIDTGQMRSAVTYVIRRA